MADPVEVADSYDEALAAGFFGAKYDPRPNEDYTVAGAISRSGELFEAQPEAEGASVRRGPGRPRKDER
jgi:hypothetical protein